MFFRHLLPAPLLFLLGLLVVGCTRNPSQHLSRLTVGVVSYDNDPTVVAKYERFRTYLAQQTKTVVELEPVFNEIKAVEQVQRQNWSLVFAPPGLAAIAINKSQYIPLFPMQDALNVRSVIVVKAESQIKTFRDLAYQVMALGEPGSAAGYYLPLYDLYGLTLQEVRFAPTPKTVLAWISDATVAAGALSDQELQRYRHEFRETDFRILHTSRLIPPGVVLLGPTVERNQQQQIERAMQTAPANITSDAGYIPNGKLPNYEQFTQLVERVSPLETQIRQKPAVLLGDDM
ncbi:MAG: phosphate/phosphite/phosphonate ABC transporter substrate-binding protein [Cyanothece sp. SIO1E1]|nr:phosphate/phosphite/phosphonate ABC transporter substrate-binding protein [Cyanothece sp. SIO1E1]